VQFSLVSPKINGTSWAHEPVALYQKKISRFYSLDIDWVRVAKIERKNSSIHKKISNEKLSKRINPQAIRICFDEKGKDYSSENFASRLNHHIESGRKQIQFFIGGPYGLDNTLIDGAEDRISLSTLVMCQEVALVTSLEQVYRALTILKNIPYHNI